ncbi:MAG: hypothetical protein ACYCOU_16230, partial [Sulfobacillus sp.]
MKRTLTALSLLLFSISIAHAVNLELGIGVSQMIHSRNTVWWQRGFQHSFSGRQPSFELGLRGAIMEHGTWQADWHLDAVSLGHFGS